MQSTQQATREDLAQRTEPTCAPKPRSHETIHRFRVEPADVGVFGVVDGGKLLEWIDGAGYAAAAQWSGRYCVTASVGNIHLDRPIGVDELVEMHASLVYTGRSSMHILITVCSSDPPGPKHLKPRSAQSFSSLSTTPATPSRSHRGHRSPCLNCNDNGKRGSVY